MPQLDPTWFASQIFWLLVTFAGLYVVLSRAILPPLQDILQQRKQTVASDVEQAEALKRQAERAQQAYEHTLASARERVQQLMDEATAASKAQADLAGKELDQRISAQLLEARQKIAAKKAQLEQSLSATSAELAGLMVEKLTQLPVNASQIQDVIRNQIKQGH